MTMDAESGQGIIELLFVIPFLIGMVLLLLRVTTTIQISIVNQKYIHSQIFSLIQNSPYYPVFAVRDESSGNDSFIKNGYNVMYIGVSDRSVEETNSKPLATTNFIGRKLAESKPNDQTNDPNAKERLDVRVKNIAAICTPVWAVQFKGKWTELSNNTFPENLSGLPFCRGYQL